MVHLGVGQTRGVQFQADCSGASPFIECVTLNPAPAATSVTLPDLGTIEIPGGASNSLLCFAVTPIYGMSWQNPTGAPAQASLSLFPTFSVESPVLTAAGVSISGPLLNHAENWRMEPGEFRSMNSAQSRNCIGGIVGARMLELTYGFSESQIRDFFAQPIVVRIGVQGSVALATGGNYLVGWRLYGD